MALTGSRMKIDWSRRSRARVWALTALGTLVCIMVALTFDSFDLETGGWRWGNRPINNFIIPMLLAPPFFLFLLHKMRQLAIAHAELMTIAATDSLTSLLNRRAFTELVDGYLMRIEASEREASGALLVIDVDHFKTVNDRFGHVAGDEALVLIARTIRDTVRETDLVGRIGGEEFGVFLPGQAPEVASDLAERIRLAVEEMVFAPDGARHTLSISVGGVAFDQAFPFSDLYRTADDRLYAAKRRGRNRVEFSQQDVGRHPPLLH
ncbi:MAG: GGDEF domain-containing protein [Hyphomonas sp.]